MIAFDLKSEVREALHDLADQGDVRPEDCVRLAVLLLSSARSQLDNSNTLCEACDRPHFNHWEQHLMYDRIKGFIKKARIVADELGRRWPERSEKEGEIS